MEECLKKLLVTGGAGFIGSNFVHYMLSRHQDYHVVVYDKLTYAGNLDNLVPLQDDPRFGFIKGDICDKETVEQAISEHQIDTIVNFAAETHVDRSIMNADAFIQTSVYGTYTLLEAVRTFGLERFHQISTDEVYGHVPAGHSSVESDKLDPRSPYAASKASADLLVSAYHVTYGLPVTITRGSNNIGPYQYPEKAVPLFATNAIDYLELPVYGDGRQMREYQFVTDHCEAIDIVLHRGEIGEVYNVGTGVELENLTMIGLLLEALDRPSRLIRHGADRPGHDRRYSLNIDKITSLGWEPTHTAEEAIRQTAAWYRDNEWWWRKIKNDDYNQYYEVQYGERLRSAEPMQ